MFNTSHSSLNQKVLQSSLKKYKNKNILVTGAQGFISRHITALLEILGASVQIIHRETHDLTKPKDVELLKSQITQADQFDYVFNLAGYNGGIDFNLKSHYDIFFANTLMQCNLFDIFKSCRHPPKKIVSFVASCAYGDCMTNPISCITPDATKEGIYSELTFLYHQPHITVEGHGFAKRNLFLLSKLFSQQYKANAICFCPTTVYGANVDWHKPQKFLHDLIRKFVQAKNKRYSRVELWGTGQAQREVIHVEDLCMLTLSAATCYNQTNKILNIGSGEEFSIEGFARIIKNAIDYQGEIYYNKSMPDGQMRKLLNSNRLKANVKNYHMFRFKDLTEGIKEVANDYLQYSKTNRNLKK